MPVVDADVIDAEYAPTFAEQMRTLAAGQPDVDLSSNPFWQAATRDNPVEGVDSWLVGAIPTRDVRGVVVLRLPAFLRIPHRRRGRGSGGVG